MRTIPPVIETLLKSRSMLGTDGPRCQVTFTDKVGGTTNKIQVSACRVSREEAANAQRCNFNFPNVNSSDPTDAGYYTPYRDTEFGFEQNEWYKQIIPSKSIKVEGGYGTELSTIFTGTIDDVEVNHNPADARIYVDCRDAAWMLIDKQITSITGGITDYYIEYPIPVGMTVVWLAAGIDPVDIANVVKDLCVRAGFAAADVTIELTGIESDFEFERMAYIDAIEELATISGFEFVIDEDNKAYFRYPTDRQPLITDEGVVLNGTTPSDLDNDHLVVNSDVVTGVGGVPVYVRNTDYEIDYAAGTIARKVGSSIPDGGTVYVDYVYAAWVFQEGEDIFGLSLKISRRNVYGKIRVACDDEDGVYSTGSPLWDGGTVPSDKVLFVDAPYIDTQADAQKTADRLGLDMLRKYICCDFAAVAVPWLQVGDCIMIVERSSTISEIYKILSMDYDFSPGGFIMTMKTFHYGYTPLE